jgi:hypothetical protein
VRGHVRMSPSYACRPRQRAGMDCYVCHDADRELRPCETYKRPVCKACARVWYEWRYAQRVTTVAECWPCCNAGLLYAATEGRALAGSVEMSASFEEIGVWPAP